MTEQFTNKAKQLFDDSVDGLDAETLSRLNRNRQAALESATGSRSAWVTWAPASGLAAAAVLAVVVMQSPQQIEAPPGGDVTDFEILMSEDSLEMLEELEFFDWMDSLEPGADADLG